MATVLEKSERLLRAYLNSVSEMAVREERRLFRLIVDEFKERMKDPGYYKTVEEFVTRRTYAKEKEEFFFHVVKGIVKTGNIREKLYKKYPGEYNDEI